MRHKPLDNVSLPCNCIRVNEMRPGMLRDLQAMERVVEP
jgi:hypothetical protein